MHHSGSVKDRVQKKVLIITQDKERREVLRFCLEGWNYHTIFIENVDNSIAPVKKIFPDVVVVDVHTARAGHLEICRLLKEDFGTASIPVITLINKRQLRSQLLNVKRGVDDYLLSPPDPLDLRIRIEMAMRRSQYTFYATPLTGLPGGRIIEEAVNERLKTSRPFSFGYLDIDNFKYFNDTYGYLRGDRAIMQAAYMLYATIRRAGHPEDFIGHIGGDDLVFITTPELYTGICTEFIKSFNKIMPFHYNEEDRLNGYIVARDRTHRIKRIPLMSVSIAIVNRLHTADFSNTIEINEKVAEIKRFLKVQPGSAFMAERRNNTTGVQRTPQVFPSACPVRGDYLPLGQRLLQCGAITSAKLDEALTIHWKRGIPCGEVMRELGFVTEEQIIKALSSESVSGISV